MGDRGPNLALDVVANDGEPGVLELFCPLGRAGDEHWKSVHEATTGVDCALGVELGGCLRSHGQVADHDIGLGGLQRGDDVDGISF